MLKGSRFAKILPISRRVFTYQPPGFVSIKRCFSGKSIIRSPQKIYAKFVFDMLKYNKNIDDKSILNFDDLVESDNNVSKNKIILHLVNNLIVDVQLTESFKNNVMLQLIHHFVVYSKNTFLSSKLPNLIVPNNDFVNSVNDHPMEVVIIGSGIFTFSERIIIRTINFRCYYLINIINVNYSALVSEITYFLAEIYYQLHQTSLNRRDKLAVKTIVDFYINLLEKVK